MKINVILAILLLSTIANIRAAQSVYIIIHGTWTTPFNWHMPGGDFYEALQASAQQYDASVAFLNWRGENSHQARIDGAKRLVNLIKTYNHDDEINLVAHSHGGNVAFLASGMLANSHYTIHSIFTLGTPIDSAAYAPNMAVIHKLYNIFSFGDMVQTVAKLYKRELPKLPGCHNVRIELNHKQPNHTALHDSIIGSWIPIPELWKQIAEDQEYLVVFETDRCPTVQPDTNRTKFREKSQALIALYNDPLRRKIIIPGFLPSDQERH